MSNKLVMLPRAILQLHGFGGVSRAPVGWKTPAAGPVGAAGCLTLPRSGAR